LWRNGKRFALIRWIRNLKFGVTRNAKRSILLISKKTKCLAPANMDAMASNLIFKQKIVGHALCIVVHSWDEIIYMVVGDYNGIRQLPSLREGSALGWVEACQIVGIVQLSVRVTQLSTLLEVSSSHS
jgi:hypothetical protein